MNAPDEAPASAADEQLYTLVHQLRQAETNLHTFTDGQVDAVITPAGGTPILLRDAMEALTASEGRYRRLITRMAAALFELLPDGTICFINDAGCAMTGYAREELMGRNCWTLFFPAMPPETVRALRTRVEARDVLGVEVPLTSKNGEVITLELTTANRYDEQGRLARVVGLGVDVTARVRALAEVRRLHEKLLSQQRLLTHRLMTTIEEERRAISFELHDGLTQYVMSSFAFLESYCAGLGHAAGEPAPATLRTGMQYLHDAVVEARRLVNGLRSLALDELGLVRALEILLQEEQERAAWREASLVQETPIPRFHTVLETAAFRLVQEALTNVRRHAESDRVRVAFRLQTDQTAGTALRIVVEDWGKGFIPSEQNSPEHVGLQSMAERVNLLKGSFRIDSTPGSGTKIVAEFPVDFHSAAPEACG